jgi:hypothetical protein
LFQDFETVQDKKDIVEAEIAPKLLKLQNATRYEFSHLIQYALEAKSLLLPTDLLLESSSYILNLNMLFVSAMELGNK